MTEIVPRETVIQTRECPDCGHSVDVKCNKNRNAYYFCDWCAGHRRWGRDESAKMREHYRKTRKAAAAPERNIVTKPKPIEQPKETPQNEQPKKPEPANDNRPPVERHWLHG